MTSFEIFDGTAARQLFLDSEDPVGTPEPGRFSDIVPLQIPRIKRRELRRRMDNDRTDTEVDSEKKVWQSRNEGNILSQESETSFLEGNQDAEIESLRDQVHILQEAVNQMMDRREAFHRMGIGFGVPLATTLASATALIVANLPSSIGLSSYLWVVWGGLAFGLISMAGMLAYTFGYGDHR